jgi:hypothetical protein
MNALPIEDVCWRDDFKARLLLERSIIARLIQCGFSHSAFEIYRNIEERFKLAQESSTGHWQESELGFQLTDDDRIQIRAALRDHCLKFRDWPRRRGCQELLQRGLLTGFEELSGELINLYQRRFQRSTRNLADEEAA